MVSPDWKELNRASWDEAVAVHLKAPGYDMASLRSGQGRLHPIEEAELGPVDGLRVIHLQCHFGRDTLSLAQRGAQVVGLDFSAPAIAAARSLASELGLTGRARFVEADMDDAIAAIAEPRAFDAAFVTWGAINWLPDIGRWAATVAHFLKPGGFLYLAEGHPAALVFDDEARMADGMPGYFAPYFQREPVVTTDPTDYADETARLQNATQYSWMHPLSAIIGSLQSAGMRLDWLHEHATVPWRMFDMLVEDPPGMYRWPDKQWLPLAFSLKATRGE